MRLLPKTVMRGLGQCADADRLTKLKSELAALELWENDYYRVQVHDDIDAVAHRNRLRRREELLGEIVRTFTLHTQFSCFPIKIFLTNPFCPAVRLLRTFSIEPFHGWTAGSRALLLFYESIL
jgi:hypothetical protein